MIRLTQIRMKIHHASSIRPIKNKLFTDERELKKLDNSIDKLAEIVFKDNNGINIWCLTHDIYKS
jgi:hypothetical protein